MLTEEILASERPREIVEALVQPLGDRRVYLGGGLFTDEGKAFNAHLTHGLEGLGFSVFLPQRDGYEAAALEGWTDREKELRIYTRDFVEVCRARFLFANLNGAIPDDGVCGEVSIAGMHKLINPSKRVIGYRSDARTWMGTMRVNPLIGGPLDALFKTVDEVMSYFAKHATAAGRDRSTRPA